MYCKITPSIQGRIRLEWTISGVDVTNVKTRNNSSGNRMLAECIKNRLKLWKFPGAVPKGGIATVRFPFVFTRG